MREFRAFDNIKNAYVPYFLIDEEGSVFNEQNTIELDAALERYSGITDIDGIQVFQGDKVSTVARSYSFNPVTKKHDILERTIVSDPYIVDFGIMKAGSDGEVHEIASDIFVLGFFIKNGKDCKPLSKGVKVVGNIHD